MTNLNLIKFSKKDDLNFVKKFLNETESLNDKQLIIVFKLVKEYLFNGEINVSSFLTRNNIEINELNNLIAKIKSLFLINYESDNNILILVEDQIKEEKIKLLKEITVESYMNFILERELTNSEKTFINRLRESYKVSDALINLAIDYSLIKNNKIVNKYVEMIIITLTREGMINFNDALKFLKEIFNDNKQKVIEKDDFWK